MVLKRSHSGDRLCTTSSLNDLYNRVPPLWQPQFIHNKEFRTTFRQHQQCNNHFLIFRRPHLPVAFCFWPKKSSVLSTSWRPYSNIFCFMQYVGSNLTSKYLGLASEPRQKKSVSSFILSTSLSLSQSGCLPGIEPMCPSTFSFVLSAPVGAIQKARASSS